MRYEYTAADNLEKPLYYHYTAYRGAAFMREWYAGLKEGIARLQEAGQRPDLPNEEGFSLSSQEERQEKAEEIDTAETFRILQCELLKGTAISDWSKERLDGYVKTFEVRKRLYPVYTARFRPADENTWRDMGLYFSFACICADAYEKYRDFRYLNVLLKVNDTLLSQMNRTAFQPERSDQEKMVYALKKEVDFITEICREKGIKWE